LTDDCPIAPTLPTMIVTTAKVAKAGAHSVEAPISAPSKSRIMIPNAAAFVADRHERRDRRRRALVDVGRPLVERRHRRLEREPGDDQRERGHEQRVVLHVP
jgi:hypothetical protein